MYEIDGVAYKLEKEGRNAKLTAYLKHFFKTEKMEVTMRFSEVHAVGVNVTAVRTEIALPKMPLNPFLIQAINYKAEQFRKRAEGARGPFEELKDFFEKRKLKQALKT